MTAGPSSIERQKAISDDLGPLQENFLITNRDYKLQYAHLYYMRLMLMRPILLKQAEKKWGKDSQQTHFYLKMAESLDQMLGLYGH